MLDPSPSDLYDAPLPADVLRPYDSPSPAALDRLLGSDGELGTGVSDADIAQAQSWQVDNDDQAEWAMAHVAALAAERAARRLQLDAWRERLEAWFDHSDAGLARRQGWFEAHLMAYARRLRDADPRRKTLDLPSGKVRSRASNARITVEDPDAFLKWADAAERYALYRIERKPELSALRQDLRAVNLGTDVEPVWRVVDPDSGEEVPGLGVTAPDVTFGVSPL